MSSAVRPIRRIFGRAAGPRPLVSFARTTVATIASIDYDYLGPSSRDSVEFDERALNASYNLLARARRAAQVFNHDVAGAGETPIVMDDGCERSGSLPAHRADADRGAAFLLDLTVETPIEKIVNHLSSLFPFPRRAPRSWRGLILVALLGAFGPLRSLALDPAEKSRDYILTRWDAEDGMPQSLVRQLYQTRDGYLWLGTAQGLSRFDGLTFTNFGASNTPGFPGNMITSMAEMADGSLWFGTTNGLGRYFEGHFTTYTEKEGLKKPLVNSVCVVPDGSLWIGSSVGIVRWVGDKIVQDLDTSAYDLLGLQTITVDRQKRIWVAIGTALLCYADGKFTRLGSEDGLPSGGIRSVREDSDGQPLAVTQNGLFRMEGNRFARFGPALASPRLNTVLADHDLNLWITSAAGLERYVNGKVELYVNPSTGKSITSDVVLEDREGCLWVGGNAGLFRVTNRRGRSLVAEDGVLGGAGIAVKPSRDGSIWVSSWVGGVARFQNGAVRQYRAGAPLSHETITCIYEAPDGTMWFGNRGSALDHLEGEKITTYVYPSGVATSRYVSAMQLEPGGDFLVGIASRGLFTLRNGQFVGIPEAAAFANSIIWDIHRTHDGRLLFATTLGLFERLPDRSFQRVVLPGLPNDLPIRHLREDADGGIWIATERVGLIHWTAGAARAYGVREGMIDDTVSSTLVDDAGAIWVTSARGMARIPRSEFADLDSGKISRLNIMTFGRVDGLLNASVATGGAPVSAQLEDGRLMFATGNGFAVIDPASLQTNKRPPPLVIESAIADDRSIPAVPGQPITLPAGTNRLEIRYTALSLIAPQHLRFRYQLQGSDPGWIEAGHERSARYTHLAPGRYSFHVLACNSDGVWNQTGATLGFIVQPFFYQTGWFVGLTVLAGGGAIFGAFRTRAQIARRRLAALESLVGERTRELRQAKESAEAAREEIARERSRFKFIFDTLPVGVAWMLRDDLSTRIVNPAHATLTGVAVADRLQLSLYRDATHPDDRFAQDLLHKRFLTGEIDRYQHEKRYVQPDGRVCWVAHTVRFFVDPVSGETQELNTIVDITEQKLAAAQLEKTHSQLLDTSRQAGMAEVATSVLHNVGNVLNSVNVSATLLGDLVRQSKTDRVARLSELIATHAGELGAFFTTDPRGQQVPVYLQSLATQLAHEKQHLLTELDSLRKNIDHIKEIVAMQQSYAKVSGVAETIAIVELIEDALRMNSGALDRHEVTLVRDFRAQPTVNVEKHKVLQILVNLMRNAKHACDDRGGVKKHMTIRLTEENSRVQIAVVDNGVGIPPENLTRIFAHGFTTRKNGHGFGLHSGALAAKELGGSLSAHSDGPGCGATFILDLPVASPPRAS